MKFEGLFRGRVIPTLHVFCVDPGETSGLAWFKGIDLAETDQLKFTDAGKAAAEIYRWVMDRAPTQGPFVVVVEDYRVYAWRAKQHTWSSLHTPRVIGGLETLFGMEHIVVVKQSAHTAKSFCKDERLEEWGLYFPGKKHARDAIRHGCYFLLFGLQNLTKGGTHV